MPKTIEGPHGFGPELSEATQVALIQLTGENLLPKLLDKSISLSDKLKKFLVFMPGIHVIEHYHRTSPLPTLEKTQQWVERWGSYLSALVDIFPKAEIKLGLIFELPFFGASFLNWEKSEGKVHVSPYVWGLEAKECPGYDIVWNVSPRPEIADAYVEGLQTLHRLTRNELTRE